MPWPKARHDSSMEKGLKLLEFFAALSLRHSFSFRFPLNFSYLISIAEEFHSMLFRPHSVSCTLRFQVQIQRRRPDKARDLGHDHDVFLCAVVEPNAI